MQLPLELTFRGIEHTDALDRHVREQAERLERFADDDIVSCRIAIEKAQERPRHGSPYRVRIELTMPPQKDLFVDKKPLDEDVRLESLIRDAFHAMEGQIKKAVQLKRREVKPHGEEPRALVVSLSKPEGYGVMKTFDGEQVYFERTAVTHDDFDRLEIGTEVGFVAQFEEGVGVRASTVHLVSKPGARAEQDAERGDIPPDWRETK